MKRKSEAGNVLIFTALSLTVLMGFAGLAIDVGVMRYEKRLQQTSADAAAISGADDIRYSSGSGITSAAQNAAGGNGFTDNNGGALCTNASPVSCVGVVVNHPPASGPHTGNSNYVEVLVSAEHPTFFMKILGINQTTVTARAVATLIGESGGSGPGCVFTLGPPGTGVGVTTGGTPTVTAPTCGIEDNGNFVTNGKKIDISAGTIGVQGTDTNNGGGTVTCTGSSTCPVTGMAPTGDPLSYVSPPCTSCTGGSALNISTNRTVSPGTYSSISITGGTVNFQPGTYIVDGNFTINGNANVTGTGVTFYITNGGSVTINGTGNVTFSAPTSGTYPGFLFYQDPADTSLAKIVGTSGSSFEGSLYFPGAQLEFGGTSGSSTFNQNAAYTIIVADDLKFFGNAQIFLKSNYTSLPGGVSIIENAILVE